MKVPSAGCEHHAATPSALYNAIAFSGRPLVNDVSSPVGAIQLVRHIGVDAPGIVSSRACHADDHGLTINLRSSGEYWGTVGGERIRRTLRRGQLSFVPAGCDVDLNHEAAHSVLVMFLRRSDTQDMLDELEAPSLRPIHSADTPRAARIVQIIEAELNRPGFAAGIKIDGLVRALVSTICDADTDRLDAQADRIVLAPARQRRVADFVEAHIDAPITLTDMAAVAGLSPFHFARVFKRASGETPGQFVRGRRVERARRLLAATDQSISDISLACGFANQSHFTSAFSQMMGISPARYRRLMRR